MKILYDISVLGFGHHDIRSRTGIFRVIENLANQLAQSEEINLSFYSNAKAYKFCYEYLLSNKNLAKAEKTFPEIERSVPLRIYSFLEEKLLGIIQKIQKNKFLSGRGIFVLRFCQLVLKKISNKFEIIINEDYLENVEIFHSPFAVLPSQIRSNKKIKKFITIYDLIPILYPDFFDFKENHIKKLIDSLQPDDWVLCISNSTKQDLCNYRRDLNPEHFIVTHPAASDLFYRCEDQAKINSVKNKYRIPPEPYILSLSTLEPRKNIALTIKTFIRLARSEKIKNVNLVLVGFKGWQFEDIFKEIENSGEIRKRIIVTGYVQDQDLAPLYSGALYFVYNSLYEGFGLPPLEAMQCGIPVLTSNNSSLPEVVGDAGIMINAGNPDELYYNMLELYNNSELRSSLALKSQQQAKKFNWEKFCRETIAAYKKALTPELTSRVN
jgi:glycosyltransferase involved in cell wall biosynthesis